MKKQEDRLRRQFEAIERKTPVGGRTLQALRRGEYRMVRIPLGALLVLGGLAGFLPVLGLWMLPLGLLLLAVDIPRLRGCVSGAIIRVRRRLDIWGRRWRRWRSG
ncbi:MAG TPA: tryptophan synthase subunit beta [Paracoccaceae bacterium]|nr:tryptophan synthase subunit beta [Paracoccaceae bacterium]